MKPHETRLISRKLAKYILHQICERVGHYSFRCGYSYTCNGQRIAVKASKFADNRNGWLFWTRRVDADKVMFFAFGRDSKVQYVWLIPCDALNGNTQVIIREDTLGVWDEYKIEIDNNIINLSGVK